MTDQRITLNPDPPVQGQSVTICYDFDGAGVDATRIRVTFGPGEDAVTYALEVEDNCITITVPDGSTSIEVVDLEGSSPTRTAPVSPS